MLVESSNQVKDKLEEISKYRLSEDELFTHKNELFLLENRLFQENTTSLRGFLQDLELPKKQQHQHNYLKNVAMINGVGLIAVGLVYAGMELFIKFNKIVNIPVYLKFVISLLPLVLMVTVGGIYYFWQKKKEVKDVMAKTLPTQEYQVYKYGKDLLNVVEAYYKVFSGPAVC